MTVRAQLLLLCVAALALNGCSDAATQGLEVRPVRALLVEPKPMDDDRRAVGEVRPRYESEFGFRVSGKMLSREVEVGEIVRKGDLLARLDEQEYRNKVRSAEAELLAAHAVLSEAQSAEGRQRQLLSNGFTTRANYDASIKNLRSAEGKFEAARASLELAQDQLSYCELRADFDGVVTAIGAEAGQVVSSGKMVVKVAQEGDKDAVFSIAESVFGTKAQDAERPGVLVSLLSEPGVSAEGVIREIAPVADPTTRTYQVKVTLKDPPEQMRFGSSVAGKVKVAGSQAVVLPGSALFDRNGQAAVWVVSPDKNSLTLRPVGVERYETDGVIINSGLAKGDLVVTAGVNRLRENQTVRLADGSPR